MVKFLRIKKISMALAVVLGGSVASDAWAASSANDNVDKQVELLSQQTAALQQQVQQLQQQIAELKTAKAAPVATPVAATVPATKSSSSSTAKNSKSAALAAPPSKPAPKSNVNAVVAADGTTSVTTTPVSDDAKQALLPPSGTNLAAEPYGGRGDLANIGGTAVITAPFIKSDRQFGGYDLIVNYSSVKKNIAIMQQDKNFVNEMTSLGLALPNYPLLELSGNIEALGMRVSGPNSAGNLNLSNAELDMQARINTWTSGFMSFAYNSGPSSGGNPISNSNLFLDNAFINIGNFDRSHYYGTVGQLYVPFGSYRTYGVTDPFTKTLFRTKGRALILGYNSTQPTGLDASVYGFNGAVQTGDVNLNASDDDTTTMPNDNVILNTYGGDLTYHFAFSSNTNVGLSVSGISNIADSSGMQSTPLPSNQFQGFGESSQTEILKHAVPGADLRFDVTSYDFEFIGEHGLATQSFSSQDLMYNGEGAQPTATHLEGDYNFKIYSRPSAFGLGYDQSNQALALGVPKRAFMATISSSILRNTVLNLELQHYINYSSNDTAGGNNGVVFYSDGGSGNGIFLQLDAYF